MNEDSIMQECALTYRAIGHKDPENPTECGLKPGQVECGKA